MTSQKCSECQRTMRHPRQSKDEHPGTVCKGNGSMCAACLTRTRRQQALGTDGIQSCPECGGLTHQGKTEAARPLGTKRRIGDGLCVSCYHARRRRRMNSAPDPAIDFDTIPYIRNRRRRGVPVDGRKYVGIEA